MYTQVRGKSLVLSVDDSTTTARMMSEQQVTLRFMPFRPRGDISILCAVKLSCSAGPQRLRGIERPHTLFLIRDLNFDRLTG